MAAAHPPGPARLHHLLGVALEWCGFDAGAAQAFQDAIRNAPEHAHTWFRLGEALARRGLWLEASEAFGEAVRRAPESPEYQGNLVLALARASKWEDTLEALRRMARLRPHEGEVLVLLGGVLLKMKRSDEAIRVLRSAVRLRSSPSTRRFFLGEALLGISGWKEARDRWLDARHVSLEAEGRREIGPGRRRAATTRGDEAFASVLAREKRAREILHLFREARPFPIRHGDRPAMVHVAPRAGRELPRGTRTGGRS